MARTLVLLGLQGQRERRNGDPLAWPSHPTGLWSLFLPSCYPGRSCCPPRPIAWRLEGKNQSVKAAQPVFIQGPCLTKCSKVGEKINEKDNAMNAFHRLEE